MVLDAGSGFGATAGLLAEEFRARAVSLDREFSRLARQPVTLERVRAGLPELPFRPAVFQAIFCECVLSLVPDKAACLEGFFRVLVRGGLLVLADLILPDRVGGDVPHPAPATCLDGALTLDALTAIVEQAGFEILKREDQTRWLRQMACEMVFEYGSLERFWEQLTGTDMGTGLSGQCRAGKLKPGYVLMVAKKR